MICVANLSFLVENKCRKIGLEISTIQGQTVRVNDDDYIYVQNNDGLYYIIFIIKSIFLLVFFQSEGPIQVLQRLLSVNIGLEEGQLVRAVSAVLASEMNAG